MFRIVLLVAVISFATKSFAQVQETVIEISSETIEYCKTHDFSPFLLTNEKFGSTGVFDTTYGRLQMHFETVIRDASNPTLYHVSGASRHMKTVTPFKGSINIVNVTRANGSLNDMLLSLPGKYEEEGRLTEPGESGPYVLVNANFTLREDSSKKYSGLFTGGLVFALREQPDGKLGSNWNRTSSNYYRNFVYQGNWKAYKGNFEVPVTWADGRIPVAPGVDVGKSEFTLSPKFEKHGWKKDADGNYLDNPEYWWRVK